MESAVFNQSCDSVDVHGTWWTGLLSHAECLACRDAINVQDVDSVNVVNVDDVNRLLLQGKLDAPGLFPRLEALRTAPTVFEMEFGLDHLPSDPGVVLIRRARQSGKSTWLEGALLATIEEYGPGSAFRVDGDHPAR